MKPDMARNAERHQESRVVMAGLAVVDDEAIARRTNRTAAAVALKHRLAVAGKAEPG